MLDKVICIDIGGSGIKLGMYENNNLLFIKKFSSSRSKPIPTKEFYNIEKKCIEFIKTEYPPDKYKLIGMSTAGSVVGTEIHRWNYIYKMIQFLENLNYIVYALNDGEAHLWSTIYDKNDGPYLGLPLGTGVGFAISSENGLIQRFQKERNIELSDVPLHYNGVLNIHQFCGYSNYIKGMLDDDFLIYLSNLRYLLQILCGLYHPKYIYIYGSIVNNSYASSYEIFNKKILPKLESFDFVKKNKIKINIGGEYSALKGAALFALDKYNGKEVYENDRKYSKNKLLFLKEKDFTKELELNTKLTEIQKKLEVKENSLKFIQATNVELYKMVHKLNNDKEYYKNEHCKNENKFSKIKWLSTISIILSSASLYYYYKK